MDYKLLALDIDGTLVDEKLEIRQSTIDLLKRIMDKGIIVTLATGRMFPSAKAIASKLNINIPLIVYNGAQIRHSQNDEYIFTKPLSLEVAKDIIKFCKENNLYLQFYQDDVIVVEKIVNETRIDPDLVFAKCKEAGDLALVDLIPSPKKMIVLDPKNTTIIEKKLKDLFKDNINVTRSKPYLIEILHPEVSKGKALKFLADKLNIKQEEVVAIGDNDNDIDMIKWAGLGAAVANSSQHLKNCAGYVAKNQYSKGVEEIINKFFLNNE